MPQSSEVEERFRFSVFELDLRAAELRKHGLRIKLQFQPYQVLVHLLSHPDEVVTREELRQQLWASDTFVDFDNNLNTSINKLRDALGDNADSPRFIETIPRRGYRFICPVEPLRPDVGKKGNAAHRTASRLRYALAGLLAVAVFLGGLAVLKKRVFRRTGATPETVAVHSLAVLPLEDLSGKPGEEYFADGMTEALISELAQISALRVISRTSVLQYKGVTKPLPVIARELNVDAVVEGTVVRSENRVRVSAQLIHAATDSHLWAATYDRDVRDVLALQSDVARAIAEQIRIKLTPQQQALFAKTRPVDSEAYGLYLRGRYHLNRRSEEELRKGLGCFQRSIEKDPSFALAYVGIADSYILLGNYGAVPQQEAILKAGEAVSHALAIDNMLPSAHKSLAVLYLNDWNWAQAEKEFREALRLDPNDARTHHWYGDFLSMMGRFDEGIAEFRRGLELEPNSLIINTELALTLLNARRSDEAIPPARQAAEMDATFAPGRAALGLAYVRNGMAATGISELKQSVALSEGTPLFLASLAYGYASSGQSREACRVLQEMKQLATRKYVAPYLVSSAYASCGRREQALLWLEKAYREHDSWLEYTKTDVLVEKLRPEPRFQRVVRRMNFPTR